MGRHRAPLHVFVLAEELASMGEYSTSMPTGPSAGRYWKRDMNWHGTDPDWVVAWVVNEGAADGSLSICWAEITVLDGWVRLTDIEKNEVECFPELPTHVKFPQFGTSGVGRRHHEPLGNERVAPVWLSDLAAVQSNWSESDKIGIFTKAARLQKACSAAHRLDGVHGVLQLIASEET